MLGRGRPSPTLELDAILSRPPLHSACRLAGGRSRQLPELLALRRSPQTEMGPPTATGRTGRHVEGRRTPQRLLVADTASTTQPIRSWVGVSDARMAVCVMRSGTEFSTFRLPDLRDTVATHIATITGDDERRRSVRTCRRQQIHGAAPLHPPDGHGGQRRRAGTTESVQSGTTMAPCDPDHQFASC